MSSGFFPSRQALADSPRSPKVRHAMVTCSPREAARAIAPPARHTKSPACAVPTSLDRGVAAGAIAVRHE